MRIFWVLIIFCSSYSLSLFAQSKKNIEILYGNYVKGIISAEEGDYRTGLKYLEKAKKLDSNSFLIRLRIATLLIRLGEMDKAEQELKEAKKIDPESVDASLALISLYSYTQNDEKLEKEYERFLEKAHKLRPEDIQISENLAQFYFYKSQPKEAIGIYEKLLEANYDNIEAIFWLGFLYEEIGQRGDAVKIWLRGLEIKPGYAPILNSLGYVYAEEGISLDEAERMLKEALSSEPQNGAYLDSLGWIYFKKKNYQEAEKYLRQAVEAVKDPVIYEHIGDLYVELNNFSEAIKFYQEGAECFPDNDKLRKKLDKYEKQDKVFKE